MPLKLNSTGGGSVTLDVGSTASNYTVTLPATSGTLLPIATVTNNGVVYINSSGAATSGSGLQFDSSGNLGLGVTPSAWNPNLKTVQASGASLSSNSSTAIFGSNVYYDSSYNPKYIATGYAGSILYNPTGFGGWAFNIAGSGTAGNAITFTQAMTLDASGNLGVGTSSPSVRLDVSGGVKSGSFKATFGTTQNLTASCYLIQPESTTTTRAYYSGPDASTFGILQEYSATSTNPSIIRYADSTQQAFYTNGTARLTINTNGNVGIGVDTSYRLGVEVTNPTRGCVGYFSNSGTSGQTGTQLTFHQGGIAYWTIGQPAATDAFSIWSGRYQNNDGAERLRLTAGGTLLLGSTSFANGLLSIVKNSTYNTESSAGIAISSSGATGGVEILIGTDATASMPYIQTVSQGIQYGGFNLRIQPNGGSTVFGYNGTTSNTVNITKNSASSYTNCQLELFSSNGDVFLAMHSGGINANMIRMQRGVNAFDAVDGTQSTWIPYRALSFTVMSDYRLKENIVPLTGALDRVSLLKPSRFNFVEGSMSYQGGRTVDGFLAHEVEDVVPEAVFGEKDAVFEDGTENHQSLDQAKLVPLLVAAIQELKAELDELKAKVQ